MCPFVNLFKGPFMQLTSQEKEILMLLADGKGSKQIAFRLNLS
jgi:DNA-binding NarL/FixJ family response regulator